MTSVDSADFIIYPLDPHLLQRAPEDGFTSRIYDKVSFIVGAKGETVASSLHDKYKGIYLFADCAVPTKEAHCGGRVIMRGFKHDTVTSNYINGGDKIFKSASAAGHEYPGVPLETTQKNALAAFLALVSHRVYGVNSTPQGRVPDLAGTFHADSVDVLKTHDVKFSSPHRHTALFTEAGRGIQEGYAVPAPFRETDGIPKYILKPDMCTHPIVYPVIVPKEGAIAIINDIITTGYPVFAKYRSIFDDEFCEQVDLLLYGANADDAMQEKGDTCYFLVGRILQHCFDMYIRGGRFDGYVELRLSDVDGHSRTIVIEGTKQTPVTIIVVDNGNPTSAIYDNVDERIACIDRLKALCVLNNDLQSVQVVASTCIQLYISDGEVKGRRDIMGLMYNCTVQPLDPLSSTIEKFLERTYVGKLREYSRLNKKNSFCV